MNRRGKGRPGFRNNRGSRRPFRGGGFPRQRGNDRYAPMRREFPANVSFNTSFGITYPRGGGIIFPPYRGAAPTRFQTPNKYRGRGGGATGGGGGSGSGSKDKNKKSAKVTKPLRWSSKNVGLTEKEVGITEYLSEHEGFTGIIKQRFADFHVNEIDCDGNVVKLTTTTPPKPAPLPEGTEEELNSTLSPEVVRKIEMLLGAGGADVEIDVTDKTKDERRKIHQAVQLLFGTRVISNTQDRKGKKFIAIVKANKFAKQDRRAIWPADRAGQYVYFVLHKENMDTMETVNLIASRLRIKPNMITYAGTKDRRGKTSQLMSVYKVEPSRLAGIAHGVRGLFLGNFSFKPQALKLGDLRGNRFRVVLRNVTGTDEQIVAAMNSLKEKGFINYYGLQRFGTSSVSTPEIGKALLLGNWKEAVQLILKPRTGEERWDMKQARAHWTKTGNALEALKLLKNKGRTIEGKLLAGLHKHAANDYVNALEHIPRNTRLLYLHAYQSLVWNKVVSRRIREFGLKPVVGDLVLVAEDVEEEVVDQEGILESIAEGCADLGEEGKRMKDMDFEETAEGTTAEAGKTGEDATKTPVKEEEGAQTTSDKAGTPDEVKADKPEEVKTEKPDEAKAEKPVEVKAEKLAGDTVEPKVAGPTAEKCAEASGTTEKIVNEIKQDPAAKNGSQKSQTTGSKRPVVKVLTEADVADAKMEDVVLPVPGHDIIYPDNVTRDWFRELLMEDGIDPDAMKKNIRKYCVSGTYRRVVVKPADLTWDTLQYSDPKTSLVLSDVEEMKNQAPPKSEEDGKYKALIVSFTLPPSTYATMALREILKVDTSASHQASLNAYHVENGKAESEKNEESKDAAKTTEEEADSEAMKISDEKEEGAQKRKAEDEEEAGSQAEGESDSKRPKIEDEPSE